MARSGLCDGPQKPFGLLASAVAAEAEGKLQVALELMREASELDSAEVYRAGMAEMLLQLGRIAEAREICPEGEEAYTLEVRARLAESPEEALELCERWRAASQVVDFELWETQARALLRLERHEEARECVARFLRARPDNCIVYDLEGRQRRLLAKLTSPPPH